MSRGGSIYQSNIDNIFILQDKLKIFAHQEMQDIEILINNREKIQKDIKSLQGINISIEERDDSISFLKQQNLKLTSKSLSKYKNNKKNPLENLEQEKERLLESQKQLIQNINNQYTAMKPTALLQNLISIFNEAIEFSTIFVETEILIKDSEDKEILDKTILNEMDKLVKGIRLRFYNKLNMQYKKIESIYNDNKKRLDYTIFKLIADEIQSILWQYEYYSEEYLQKIEKIETLNKILNQKIDCYTNLDATEQGYTGFIKSLECLYAEMNIQGYKKKAKTFLVSREQIRLSLMQKYNNKIINLIKILKASDKKDVHCIIENYNEKIAGFIEIIRDTKQRRYTSEELNIIKESCSSLHGLVDATSKQDSFDIMDFLLMYDQKFIMFNDAELKQLEEIKRLA